MIKKEGSNFKGNNNKKKKKKIFAETFLMLSPTTIKVANVLAFISYFPFLFVGLPLPLCGEKLGESQRVLID